MGFYTYLKTTDNYTLQEEELSYMLMRRELKQVMKNTKMLLRLPRSTPLHIVRSLDIFSTGSFYVYPAVNIYKWFDPATSVPLQLSYMLFDTWIYFNLG